MTEPSPRRLSVSFSGGETSAEMTKRILESNEFRARYDEIVVTFANTTLEDERTLVFVDRCDKAFGFNTVWLEGVTNHGERKSASHKVVSFETARRSGEAMEDAIQKYGIPNKDFPHCTRTLKTEPMKSYLRSLGWGVGSYQTAVGIRVDEIDRMTSDVTRSELIYPLISNWPLTKPEINEIWKSRAFRSEQNREASRRLGSDPFRLELPAWRGNCVSCWKKTIRKHYRNIQDTPEDYDFFERMEAKYPRIGAEFRKKGWLPDRTFFRGRKSTLDLRAEASAYGPVELKDSNEFDPDLDVGEGCEESCEIYSEGSMPDLGDED